MRKVIDRKENNDFMKIVKDWKLVYNEESKYEYYKEIK